MKKFFVLMLTLAAFSAGSAYAYDYSHDFYDKFFDDFFSTTSFSLIQGGIAPGKVDNYVKEMKARIDRRTFENSTWACVRENELVDSFVETGRVDDKCFEDWKQDFMIKNADLLELLK